MTVALGQKEGTAKLGTVALGMGLNTSNPIVVGFYSGQPIAQEIKAFGVRRDNPLYDLTLLTDNIKKSGPAATGMPALIVGDDCFRSALLRNQFARQGVSAIQVPSDADWRGTASTFPSPVVAGIQDDLSERLKKVRQLPPPHPPPGGAGIPTMPWTGFQFIRPTPILPGKPPPGGIDLSMARARVDKGKWLVNTTFGLRSVRD